MDVNGVMGVGRFHVGTHERTSASGDLVPTIAGYAQALYSAYNANTYFNERAAMESALEWVGSSRGGSRWRCSR